MNQAHSKGLPQLPRSSVAFMSSSAQAAKRAFLTDSIEAWNYDLHGKRCKLGEVSQQCRFGQSQVPLKKLDESGHMYTISQRVMYMY